MKDRNQLFAGLYGAAPEVRAVAPGRVNLIGDHIDYLGGAVLPMAIEVRLEILVAPVAPVAPVASAEKGYDFWSDGLGGEVFRFEDLQPETAPERRWLNYAKGVLAEYQERGIVPPFFHAAVFSNIPSGAGLSSSAALATACALAIERLAGVELSVVDRALLCQSAEHKYAGVPCGIMDQLAIGAGAEGCAVRIDCEKLTTDTVPLPPGLSVVIADTGAKHSLSDGQYRARREDCERALEIVGKSSYPEVSVADLETARAELGDRLFRRARHAVTEIARVEKFIECLRRSDYEGVGAAMAASHRSLRDDFEVSCEELDCLVAAAESFGAERGLLGARMTGGGFGGSTVSLVRKEAAPALIDHLRKAARNHYGGEVNPFSCLPSAGASSQSLLADLLP